MFGTEVLRYQSSIPGLEIFVIQPGERLTLFGTCSVACLAGTVSINDYILPCVSYEDNKMVKVSAPLRMDMPAIIQVFRKDANYKHLRLQYRLKDVSHDYLKIMEVIGESQPAVLIVKNSLEKVEEVVGSLVPNFFVRPPDRLTMFRQSKFSCSRMDLYVLPKDVECEVIGRLTKLKAIRNNGKRGVVMPIGTKGVGKSTFVRSLINRCISSFNDGHVYVLDCDPGQSEFTACGSMSLTKVTSPILDKPFGHQKTEWHDAYFYGDIRVQTEKRYIDIFERLWNQFNEISEPGSILIINTMGWIEGLGKTLLHKMISIAKPDIIFELRKWMSNPAFIYPDNTDFENQVMLCEVNEVPQAVRSAMKQLHAGLIRELTMVGYFSAVLTRPSISSLLDVVPYKISFKDASFCVPIDLLVDDLLVFASLNTQIVALCQDNNEIKFRRLSNREDFPQIAAIDDNTPSLKCLGYAIIRGINIEKKEIYLITPVDLRSLDEVPLFVRGLRIHTPTQIYTCDQYNQSPYVVNLAGNDNEPVKERVIEDLFQPSTNTTAFKRSRKH